MNFVFMVNGQPVTVPMPYGYNFFSAMGRKMSEILFRENYTPAKGAVDLASVFFDAFSPVGHCLRSAPGKRFVFPGHAFGAFDLPSS